MNKYQRGKIYKIESDSIEGVYIGSTCEPTLARRLAGHVSAYNQWLKGKCSNVSSFQLFINNDYHIVLLESFPCNTKDELYARERYHISNTPDCINIYKGVGLHIELGDKEYDKYYYERNKQNILLYQKQYQNNNKEKVREGYLKYYEEHKEHVDKYRKEYAINHRQQINECKKKYVENHKEIVRQHIICDCGGTYTKQNKSQHMKSLIHKQYIALTTPIIYEPYNLEIRHFDIDIDIE